MKNKLKKIVNSKFFIPWFVISINIIFCVILNLKFYPRYETIDDFMIMKILSKLDGTYNFYSVYMHPIISIFIILLYKTGININWYTIFLLTLQFISFTTIGIIFLNKNKKIGTLCYIMVLFLIYLKVLLIINYTSIASITILAGLISIMYYNNSNEKNYRIIGILLVTIGTMVRWKSIIISLPFYILYTIYNILKYKDFRLLKLLIDIILIVIILIFSNNVIYRINPIYKKHAEFNKIRTYFFDYNILDYNANREIFDECGWTYNDWKMFYTYSFSDEKFYNTENLVNLKESIDDETNVNINKIIYTFKTLIYTIQNKYMIFFASISLITLISILINKNKSIVLGFFLIHILINYVLCYIKPTYRVIISLYATTIIMILYVMIDKSNKSLLEYLNNDQAASILTATVICLAIKSMFLNIVYNKYNPEQYRYIREVIDYTNVNKQNAYVYPNVLGNISLAYSIYEKIPDGTFSNLRHMGDWDAYDKKYYEFKEEYNIDNIITDLCEKDNLFIITGEVGGADYVLYNNHIDTIKQYILEHYNKKVGYKVVKEFNGIKIYKLYET